MRLHLLRTVCVRSVPMALHMIGSIWYLVIAILKSLWNQLCLFYTKKKKLIRLKRYILNTITKVDFIIVNFIKLITN